MERDRYLAEPSTFNLGTTLILPSWPIEKKKWRRTLHIAYVGRQENKETLGPILDIAGTGFADSDVTVSVSVLWVPQSHTNFPKTSSTPIKHYFLRPKLHHFFFFPTKRPPATSPIRASFSMIKTSPCDDDPFRDPYCPYSPYLSVKSLQVLPPIRR